MNAHWTPTADDVTLTDEERQPCEVWTRVMGYHRPVSSFNQGKVGEFNERQYFRKCKAERPDADKSAQ